MNCSRCNAPLAPGSMFCPKCGLPFGQPVPGAGPGYQPQQAATTAVSDGSPALRVFGCLVLLGGLALAGYYFLIFDTSVTVPTTEMFGQTVGGEQVNNLGLMAERQNGILIGMGGALLGAIMMYAGRAKS